MLLPGLKLSVSSVGLSSNRRRLKILLVSSREFRPTFFREPKNEGSIQKLGLQRFLMSTFRTV
jgi:hypothetical protein